MHNHYLSCVVLSVVLMADSPLVAAVTRCMTLFPFTAKVVSAATSSENCEVKSLMFQTQDYVKWKPSKWDIDLLATADCYVSIGADGEEELLRSALRSNYKFNIVFVGAGVTKIKGNPYFFVSLDNQEIIMHNTEKAFSVSNATMCARSNSLSSVVAGTLGTNDYSVAIAHPAFEYECVACGVNPRLIDFENVRNEDGGIERMRRQLWSEHVNLILSLPGSINFDADMLALAGAQVVEINPFGPDVSKIPLVISEAFKRRESDRTRAHIRFYGQPDKLLECVFYNNFEIREGATLLEVFTELQESVNDLKCLPQDVKIRSINLVLQSANAKTRRMKHAILSNVTGMDIFTNICEETQCVYTYPRPTAGTDEPNPTFYIFDEK